VTESRGQAAPRPTIAVIGVGRWGSNIVRDLALLGVDVVAVDPDATARDRAVALGAVAGVDALAAAPHAIDAAVIATPASRHETDVLALTGFDRPIACEKPLTVSSRSARAIVDAVGGRLTVLHVWRYHPGVELLGELARSGVLGDLTAVATSRTNWTSPRTDVDPVWTLLPHDLSIAAEVLGAVPTPRAATVERIDGRAVGIWATFGSAPPLVVEASTRSGARRRDIAVHGTHAVAVLHDDHDHVEILTGTSSRPDVDRLTFDPTPALQRELAAFVDHVRGGPPPKTAAAEGLAVVEAVEQALALGSGTGA
jgi:predicted dehydrogenase